MSKGLVNAHLLRLLAIFSAVMLILQLSHLQSKINYKKQINFPNRSFEGEEIVWQRARQFSKALARVTLLNSTRFAKFREDSIRYFGNELKINRLLWKLFRNEKTTLNIAITGGSNSVARVSIFCFIVFY